MKQEMSSGYSAVPREVVCLLFSRQRAADGARAGDASPDSRICAGDGSAGGRAGGAQGRTTRDMWMHWRFWAPRALLLAKAFEDNHGEESVYGR